MDTVSQELCWVDGGLPENYLRGVNHNGAPFFYHKLASLSSSVSVGDYTYIHGTSRLTGDKEIRIGNYCSIASGVRIQVGDNHDYNRVSTFPFKTVLGLDIGYPEAVGSGVVIGNDVWIGEGVRILSGSVVGDGAVIGAGSVVKGNIRPYGIYVGNPAVCKKLRFDEEVVSLLQQIAWWNWPVALIKQQAEFFTFDLRGASVPEAISFLKRYV